MIVTHLARTMAVVRAAVFGLALVFATVFSTASARAQAPSATEAGWTLLYSQGGGSHAAVALSDDGETLYWTQ